MKSSTDLWKPGASLEMLQQRARLWQKIRTFFAARAVLEVETPILSRSCAPEPAIEPLRASYQGATAETLYLQSSPELAMKRLLAAGSGPIFQIAHAFRDGESGRRHNPEFSLLEWYRPGFDLDQLMDEMDDLLQLLLGCKSAQRSSYVALFEKHLEIHPLQAELSQLRALAQAHGLYQVEDCDTDTCLDFLMGAVIEPRLGQKRPLFVYDYPASQAALARLHPENPALARRFEVYFQGVELANGFHELADAGEQRSRFIAECAERRAAGLHVPPLDEHFFAALEAGLPDCSGVALGLDRVLMLATGAAHIDEVLAFPLARI